VRGTLLFVSLLSLAACRAEPSELPTQERVREVDALDAETVPPLYQFMYDSAFLPEVQVAEQRARLLVWLRWVELQEYQLQMLLKLHGRSTTLRERLETSQQRIVQRHEPQLAPHYDRVFELLSSGAALDDPRLGRVAEQLAESRVQQLRDDDLLAIRMQSVRALLDEEQELLRTLSPDQEARFPDMVFALRRQLDMASSSGDFRAMVGSLYSVGDPTLLLRGDFEATRQHLDISGLWVDDAKAELSGPVLHQARRELLLYLLLQETALPEAIEAALQVRATARDSSAASPSVQPAPVGAPGAPGGVDNVRPPPGAQPLPPDQE